MLLLAVYTQVLVGDNALFSKGLIRDRSMCFISALGTCKSQFTAKALFGFTFLSFFGGEMQES
jgi:hypothetical protein